MSGSRNLIIGALHKKLYPYDSHGPSRHDGLFVVGSLLALLSLYTDICHKAFFMCTLNVFVLYFTIFSRFEGFFLTCSETYIRRYIGNTKSKNSSKKFETPKVVYNVIDPLLRPVLIINNKLVT